MAIMLAFPSGVDRSAALARTDGDQLLRLTPDEAAFLSGMRELSDDQWDRLWAWFERCRAERAGADEAAQKEAEEVARRRLVQEGWFRKSVERIREEHHPNADTRLETMAPTWLSSALVARLAAGGIVTVGDAAARTRDELLQIRYVQHKSVDGGLREILTAAGLAWRDTPADKAEVGRGGAR